MYNIVSKIIAFQRPTTLYIRSQMPINKIRLLILWSCFLTITAYAQDTELDVLSYKLTIEPNIQNQSIEASLLIQFEVADGTEKIALDASNLEIDGVSGTSVLSYNKVGSKLVIELSPQNQTQHELTIEYHGKPKRGLLFNPDLNQAHTVYFTDQWMVCNNQPSDRATFFLNIILPKGMQSIASGSSLGVEDKGEKALHKWHQDYETPPYTYGFVIGSFTEATEQIGDVKLHYYSSELDEYKLKEVFTETANILEFFEQKSGLEYVQDSYSQILIGDNYQEMSGLSVLAKAYPPFVFKDSSEIHLTSHELAHQWWGNMITCEDFGHFWLNEAFAVYMSSAFSEHKFGLKKYQSDIAIYKNIYDDLVKRGKDRPLIFKEWRPSRDNRNVIYYKGAYVLHLLREELGDEAFWKGIRSYSTRYFGKSVKTEDFKLAMEKATSTNLDDFFDTWVYK
ncbi:MAG: M1 family metallopeptidase [Roseivirga sp.]|nr:M1 family metallopeptidase [Roseivirga sp.]